MSEIPYFRIARMQGGTRAINSAYRGCNRSKRKAWSNLSFHCSFFFIIKRGDVKNRDIDILTIVHPFSIHKCVRNIFHDFVSIARIYQFKKEKIKGK